MVKARSILMIDIRRKKKQTKKQSKNNRREKTRSEMFQTNPPVFPLLIFDFFFCFWVGFNDQGRSNEFRN